MSAVRHCRSCGAAGLLTVLSLGLMPLANALLSEDDLAAPEPRYLLDLVRCGECSLVQITETVSPEVLFRNYAYFSSVSDSFLRHAETLVARLCEERGLGADHLALEVASNDGYLLQFYRRRGVPVLGIEPARNVAEVAERERGVPTVCEFFGEDLARRLRAERGGADVIHANNVLAHVADLNGFVRGIARVLRTEGVAVIEVPYVKDMIDGGEFDTIYHEHLCYFSMTSLERLFRRHGLNVNAVERLAVHGGSLRVFVGHVSEAGTSVRDLLEQEREWGIDRPDFYDRFSGQVARSKAALRELVGDLRCQGHTIAAYGAAAKGATLLNYYGLGADVVRFVADRSPHKQGRFVPGVRVPIRPPEALLAERPDYVLLLAWNLADEVLSQQSEYRRGGGRFIIPIPELRVV